MALNFANTFVALLTGVLGCYTGAAWSQEPLPHAQVEATIPRFGDGMGAGFGYIWIMSDDSLGRIRINDNSVTDIKVPGALGRRVFGDTITGEGAVWAPDADHGVIYKVDPVSNQVAVRINADLAGHGESLGVGEGSVWAICGDGDVLRRFAVTDGTEQAAVRLPANGFGILVAHGAVWVTSPGNDELYRIDPASNRIVSTTEVGSGPRFSGCYRRAMGRRRNASSANPLSSGTATSGTRAFYVLSAAATIPNAAHHIVAGEGR